MAKEMMSFRIEPVLRDALAAEAKSQGRSLSNMLERVLDARYGRGAPTTSSSGVSAGDGVKVVLTERGGDARLAERDMSSERFKSSPSPRSVSAAVSPEVHDTGVRPHMKKHRPAVECPTRWPSGVCPDCGTVVT